MYVQFPSAWLAVEQISYTMSHGGGAPLHLCTTELSIQPKKRKKKLNQAKPNQTRPHSRLGSADFRCPTTGSILAPYSKKPGTSASDPGIQGRTEDEGKATAKP